MGSKWTGGCTVAGGVDMRAVIIAAILLLCVENIAYISPLGAETGAMLDETLTEEQEKSLEDNVLEYWELETLIRRFNPEVQEAMSVYNRNVDQYADLWSQLRFYQSSAYTDKRNAKQEGDSETYSYYASEEETYRSAANTYKKMYDNLQTASETHSIRSTIRQLTVAAQSLMISYESLCLQKDTLEQQMEVCRKQYQLETVKKEAGMATKADVLEAQKQLEAAESDIAALQESMGSIYSSLCLSVGKENDGSVAIAPIPIADISEADTMDLEADTKKAIGNNTALIEERHQKASGTSAKIGRNGVVEEDEQQLTSEMKRLYEEIMQKRSELETAEISYSAAQKTYELAEIQAQAGLLNQEEVLTEEMDMIQAEADYRSAGLAYTQAVDTYKWAVAGTTEQ